MAARKETKKSFAADLNPAMAILQKAEPAPDPNKGKEPRRLHIAAARETYSQRVQLLVKPSTVKILKEDAEAVGVSFNAYINALFEEYISHRYDD